jgi:hypothetical protein
VTARATPPGEAGRRALIVNPICFVDDDPSRHGHRLNDLLPVLGPVASLEEDAGSD